MARQNDGLSGEFSQTLQGELSVAVRRLEAVTLGDPVMPVADGSIG